MKRIFTVLISAAFACGVSALTINDVVIRQQWPWSGKVSIDFGIEGADSATHAVTVTAYNDSTLLGEIPAVALSGDTLIASNGWKHIEFDPAAVSFLKTQGLFSNFRVELAVGGDVLYLIIDLSKCAGEEGQITYVTRQALTNNEYGAWEPSPVQTNGVTVKDTVIWTDVTNQTVYATTKLVLRYIPAGFFQMGSPTNESYRWSEREKPHQVNLTKPFFAGVFPVTKAQWQLIMGSLPTNQNGSAEQSPVTTVTYDAVRGSTNAADNINWPLTTTNVTASSFIGMLRDFTGFGTFDLPTEAQWEYAGRAGVVNGILNGHDVTNATSDVNLGAVAWYQGNAVSVHQVGLREPNAWGLYDVQGNVCEWVLDWFEDDYTKEPAENPLGPVSGPTRISRGGGWATMAKDSRIARRGKDFPGIGNSNIGLRLFLNMP